MRRLLFLLLLAPATALGQPADLIERVGPDFLSTTIVETLDQNADASSGWQNCLVFDTVDFTLSRNWFRCQPCGAGDITRHIQDVSTVNGDLVLRAVTVNPSGVASNPSANMKTVVDVPLGPDILSLLERDWLSLRA